MEKLDNIDLRLLQVFDHVYRLRNLSRAAERMGLTQPAVSQSLARLRRHFGEPLFVRAHGSMEPTPLADQLHALASNSMALLEALLAFQPSFDPQTDTRSFRIGMTDVGQVVILPRLLNTLARVAPHIQVAVHQIAADSEDQLERGALDLTLGFLPDAQGGFVQQPLFHERFSCLVQRDHPRVGSTMSLRQYRQELHAVVNTPGTGHSIVERSLARKGVVRRTGGEMPNFIGLAMIVANTELVATLPHRAAQILSQGAQVRLVALPVDIPGYHVRQQWHERMQRDPGHVWLRSLIATLFKST